MTMWATKLDQCKDPSDYAWCTCAEYSCGYSQPNRKNEVVPKHKMEDA